MTLERAILVGLASLAVSAAVLKAWPDLSIVKAATSPSSLIVPMAVASVVGTYVAGRLFG